MQARGSLVRSFVSAAGGGGGRRGGAREGLRGVNLRLRRQDTLTRLVRARGGWWRQGTSETAGHDVRYRFRQPRDRGLRESPTRPLRASLRVARWLNPRKKLQAQSCRLVGAAKEGRGAQGDAKGRAKGRKRDPTRRALSFLPFWATLFASVPLVRSFRRTRCGFRRW